MKSRALHVDFLLQARKLAARERGSPTQGGLRRATSTAYFALFHFLVDEAARAHMGSHRARSSARGLLARAFQHTTMVQASKAFSSSPMHPRLQAALGTPVPMELLREVAATFCDLQRARHTADYDPLARFAADDVHDRIQSVENVIARWRGVRADPSARLYLASLLAWDRLRDR